MLFRSIKISIILPVYNGAEFLADSLNSVLCQTFADWECIIINDCSLDNSLNIAQDFASSDSRFKIISNEKNMGVSYSRNRGLDVASGEYIAFLDADDLYMPNALEHLYNIAIENNLDIVGGMATVNIIPPINTSVVKITFLNTPYQFFETNDMYKWCWIWRRIYKREILKDVRFINGINIGEDICFMFDISHKKIKMAEINIPVVVHRVNNYSITNREFSNKNFEFFPYVFENLKNHINDYPTNVLRKFYNALFLYMVRETVFAPMKFKIYKNDANRVLRQSVKLIPKKYLSFKNRFFTFFLQT